MNNLQGVIDKIAKLRALAQSDNVNEAATAAALAEKLIQEHRLSEAELQQTSGAPDETPAEEDSPLTVDARIETWKWHLADALGSLYGVALWYKRIRTTSPRKEWPGFVNESKLALTMIGRKSDIEIMRYQYAYLSVEIERLTQAFGKAHKFIRGEARTALNSFRLGAVTGVTRAMKTAASAVTSEAPAAQSSAAMVLVSRLKQSEALKKKLHPNLRSSGGGSSRLDGNAWAAGKSAGENIHRGGALTSGVRGALKGGT